MDAIEASKRATIIKFEKTQGQYEEIKAFIERAVEHGQFECHYYQSILEGVEDRLRDEGFDVSSFPGRNGEVLITITW